MVRQEVEHHRRVGLCSERVGRISPRNLEPQPCEVERAVLGQRRRQPLDDQRNEIDGRVLRPCVRHQQLPRGEVRRRLGDLRGIAILEAHAEEAEPEAGLEVAADQLDRRRADALDVVLARGAAFEAHAVVLDDGIGVAALDEPRLDQRGDLVVIGARACGGDENAREPVVEVREPRDPGRMNVGRHGGTAGLVPGARERAGDLALGVEAL